MKPNQQRDQQPVISEGALGVMRKLMQPPQMILNQFNTTHTDEFCIDNRNRKMIIASHGGSRASIHPSRKIRLC